jgi:hypothetical protein
MPDLRYKLQGAKCFANCLTGAFAYNENCSRGLTMIRRFQYVLLSLLAFSALLPAQTSTATVEGYVKDPSGASVSDAVITVVNVHTGASHQVKTNAEGHFVVPYLLPGEYKVAAEHAGFQRFEQSGIKLDVQQVLSFDIPLNIGNVSATVEVSAATPPLATASSVISTTVDNKKVVDLPLNGRVSLGLSLLVPGVIPAGGNAGSSIGVVNGTAYPHSFTPWISGSRNATSDVLLDGIPLGVPNTNGGTLAMGVSGPTVDAVQEFAVLTSAPPAEYGRTGGGIIDIASKAGTNELHGSLYEFLRNSDLDANNFFSNRAGIARPIFQRNQFGGSVGGPVNIPHVYDGRNRTFFFFDTETTYARIPDVFTTTVPIDAWKQGDFSGLKTSSGQPITIYDPTTTTLNSNGIYTRSPFAGNQIPLSRMDPVAMHVMNYYPEPNTAPANVYTQVNNWTEASKDAANSTDFGIRLDHSFNNAWRTFMRYTQGSQTTTPHNFFDSPATPQGRGTQTFTRHAFVWNNTYVINPTSVLEFRYGLSRFALKIAPLSTGFDPSQLGLPSYMDLQAAYNETRFPRFDVNGITSLGQITGAGIAFVPTTHNVLVSLTKVLSKHTIKTGFEYRKFFLNFWQEGIPTGQFSFDSTWTQQIPTQASSTAGFGLASMLLGLPTSGSQTNNPYVSTASSYYAGYIQDDYRLNSRVTLNLGLRYDVDTPRTERHNQLSYFNANVPSPLAGEVAGFPNLMGQMDFARPGAREQGPTDWNNVSPRFGFAIRLNDKTAFRGAYAFLYGPSLLQAGYTGTTGFQSSTSMIVSLDSLTPLNYLSNPFPYGFNPALGATAGPNSGALTNIGLAINGNWFLSNKSPEIQEWNANIQRELPLQFVLEVGYVANKGNALDEGETLAYNQLPDSALALGTKLNSLVANPFYNVITNPNSPLSKSTVQLRYLLAPYPQYTGLGVNNVPLANSIYHSVIVKLERRFSNGFGILASYTGGKLIDDSGFASTLDAGGATSRQDVYNQKADRSVSAQDISSRFVASVNYELPFGHGKPFLSSLPTFANAILGGWQANAIVTMQDGLPVLMSQAVNQTGIGNSSQRPNVNGQDPNLSNRSISEWFDTSVFSVAPAYTFGNAPRTLPNVRQPGLNTADLSVFKSFHIKERATVTFRAEAFNAFNKTQFGSAASTVGSSNFGVISSTAVDAREFQFALKLLF